ncbi:NADP-dependent oxidoreductase domain-containing protein [Flagelloscypha sp. PMI_526]|nr:NADP-dependent oxidoreductase domain-containing protein [Flagelloscypha sp. PMI_526]
MAHYRRLGSSGLRVSVPIFGAMSIGLKDWQQWVVEGDEAIELLKAAWDRGINTFDTANVYSNGISEELLGQFIEKYNIPRSKILVCTKCNSVVTRSEPGILTFIHPELRLLRDNINQFGLSRAAIFNAVEDSLQRLGTSYIDLFQIHRFDKDTPVEETMKALHDLVQSGKVRYIGASSMRTWQFAMMNEVADKHGWTKFSSMQDEYSLLYREEEREMIPYCKFNGIGVIPWSPLAGGLLARPLESTATTRGEAAKSRGFARELSEASKRIISRVEEVSQKKGWTMAQVALAWVNGKIDSPIVGLGSVERVDESILEVGKFVLSEEETKYLEEPYEPVPVRGHQ